MKQMFVVGHGGPEKLQLRESPEPSPAGGQIRIRVKASGVNFADILARQGLYPDSPKVPCVVGYEVSGTVDTVGSRRGPCLGRQGRLCADALRRLFGRGSRAGETDIRETGLALP